MLLTLALSAASCRSALEGTPTLDTQHPATPEDPRVLGNGCDDVPPDPQFSCAQQVSWGKCEDPFMAQRCNASCGRCGPESGPERCPGVPPSEPEVATRAFPRLVDHSWMSARRACDEHRSALVAPERRNTELVFIGDSITRGWITEGREVWSKRFGAYRPLNLGVSGDQTQNVLWRIEHGALDGLEPKVVVLLIGVNNLGFGGFSAEDTALGTTEVVKAILARLPRASILQLAILPAMKEPEDQFRRKIAQANQILRNQARTENVTFFDSGGVFVSQDGRLSRDTMPDFLHPNARGYALWADALAPRIESLIVSASVPLGHVRSIDGKGSDTSARD